MAILGLIGVYPQGLGSTAKGLASGFFVALTARGGRRNSFPRTALPLVAIALKAGVLRGAAYPATQRLWLPIGQHTGWNFTEDSIFGMSVSGNNMSTGLIH
jgi:membrane protease YdiL (CAAX protease family)